MNVDLSQSHELKFIDYGSEEYYQAAHLRYRIFYRDCGVDFTALIGETERTGSHVAIVVPSLAVGEASVTLQHLPKRVGVGFSEIPKNL